MSLSKADKEVLNSVAISAANAHRAIVVTEDGWLVTQSKHRQEQQPMVSYLSIRSSEMASSSFLGRRIQRQRLYNKICQNSPLLLKTL